MAPSHLHFSVGKNSALIVVSAVDDMLLRAVHRYHFLTSEQMTRLHYSSGSRTYVRARLKRLTDARYLQRIYLPCARTGGSSPSVFTLGSRGIGYLRRTGVDTTHRFRPSEHNERSYLFLSHTLAVNDVLIAAELLPRTTPIIELKALRHERDLRRWPVRVDNASGKVTVVPDGWLDFRLGGRLQMCIALELDRGTIEARAFRSKIAALRSFAHGPYRDLFGTSSLTIAFAVDAGARRLRVVQSWIEQALRGAGAEADADLFRLTRLPDAGITPSNLFLAPCWLRPFGESTVPLLEL